MELETLTEFFRWMTIIGGGLVLWSALWIVAQPKLTFRIHSRFFAVNREQFNAAIYVMYGVFKVLVLVFCLLPYIALSIMG